MVSPIIKFDLQGIIVLVKKITTTRDHYLSTGGIRILRHHPMPNPSSLLRAFGLRRGIRVGDWTLSTVSSTHEEVVRFRSYRYSIRMRWTSTSRGRGTGLLNALRRKLSGSKVVYSGYHNPYRCTIGSIHVSPNGSATAIAHATRIRSGSGSGSRSRFSHRGGDRGQHGRHRRAGSHQRRYRSHPPSNGGTTTYLEFPDISDSWSLLVYQFPQSSPIVYDPHGRLINDPTRRQLKTIPYREWQGLLLWIHQLTQQISESSASPSRSMMLQATLDSSSLSVWVKSPVSASTPAPVAISILSASRSIPLPTAQALLDWCRTTLQL